MVAPAIFSVHNSSEHTMGGALYRYLDIKIHPHINQFLGKTIVVRGKYNREQSVVFPFEKRDKMFNWKRPSIDVSIDGSTLYVNCFPGVDYVCHYASLIQSYCLIKGANNTDIRVEAPEKHECFEQLLQTNLSNMPHHDIVIVGKVERLHCLTHNSPWGGEGDFLWSTGYVDGKKVALLGCAFSIWGDIAGNLVRVLADKGVRAIMYTGKLGGLHSTMFPNESLATGNTSMLRNTLITWDNIIKVPDTIDVVLHGPHITVFSVLAETKKWLEREGKNYSFVDPEIGHMAYWAKVCDLQFGYIHLVSDNVVQPMSENLSNERMLQILKKRDLVYEKIYTIIYHSTMGII